MSMDRVRAGGYGGLDLLKLVLSYLIVMRHFMQLFLPNDSMLRIAITNGLSTVATPVFFMISGFLLFGKDYSGMRLKRQISRVLILYFVWSVIYAPFAVRQMLLGELTISKYMQEAVFGGTAMQLWYLPSLVFALLVVSLLRKMRYVTGFCIAGVLFVIGLLFDAYDFLIPKTFDLVMRYRAVFLTSRNGVFFGTIYVYLGMFFAGRNIRADKRILKLVILLCVVLLEVEGYIVYKIAGRSVVNISIAALPAAICLFLLAVRTKLIFGLNTQLMLRKMSTAIYCVHMWCVSIVNFVREEYIQLDVLLCFVIVMAGVTLSSYMIVKISERNKLAAMLV